MSDEQTTTSEAPETIAPSAPEEPETAPRVPEELTPEVIAAEKAASEASVEEAEGTEDSPSEESTTAQTQGMPVSPTEQIPSPGEGPRIETQPASLHDVASAAESFARSHLSWVHKLFSVRGLVVAIVAVVAVALIGGAYFTVNRLADLPDTSLFRQDAQSLLTAPTHNGGAYGIDEPFILSDIEVTSRHKDVASPSKCEVNTVVTYSNGAVSAQQEATLRYERQDGSWTCVSAEPIGGASFSATTGVDRQKLRENINGILQRAEASRDDETGSIALPTLYAGAEVEVLDETFDEESQTDVATLHISKSDTFTSYECDVKATFSFRPGNGLWELTSAEASSGAKDATLTPLIGTWTGTFRGQVAYEGKCYGAKDYGLRVVITHAEGHEISGTIDCLAHYHADLSADSQETEGDTQLTEVPFTGTLVETSPGLTFTCTTPEAAEGVLELQLTFGSEASPTAVSATLTTKHDYVATILLFIPYDEEATFSDTFVLSRE